MSFIRSEELSHLGLQLGVLAATFAQQPQTIRAVTIRKAERALIALESFANGPVPSEAQQWLKAIDAFKVLQGRIGEFEKLHTEMTFLQSEIDQLTKTLRLWNALQDAERQKFIQNHARAKQFSDQNLAIAEAHILHKYSRYKALNRLLPYADNSEHLCDAIFHFQNREKYEESIEKIESRKDNALERLASVKRGFNLALFMCILIVSLPLCVPVALSLWNRRRDIESQLANMNESKKREERRLQIADEGVIAAEEIREILGDVPLETVRRTLEELRELRSEFQRVDRNPSVTAALVAFVDLYKPRLKELFGDVPEDMATAFVWFKDEVDRVLNVEAERAVLQKQLSEKQIVMRQLLRGHGEAILRDSYNRVKEMCAHQFQVALEDTYKTELARSMSRLPDLLQSARYLLSQLSHGKLIETQLSKDVFRWLLTMETQFQAMSLELQLANQIDEIAVLRPALEQKIS
jgi:hypothetical protein